MSPQRASGAPLRFVWLLPDEARTAPDALTPAARAAAAARAFDLALDEQGAEAWSAPTLHGGERETGFQDYVTEQLLRGYASGAQITLGSIERMPDAPQGRGVPNGNTVFAALPGAWLDAWAQHERISAALAPLGYRPVSLEWASTAEALFMRLEADGDAAALSHFAARCDEVVRRVVAATPPRGTLDLQRRPYLDLEALLALAPADLRRLWLPHNRLVTVPDGVRRLTALDTLELHHNPLEILPAWLGELRQLQHLSLLATSIMTQPAQVEALQAQLPQLRVRG